MRAGHPLVKKALVDRGRVEVSNERVVDYALLRIRDLYSQKEELRKNIGPAFAAKLSVKLERDMFLENWKMRLIAGAQE